MRVVGTFTRAAVACAALVLVASCASAAAPSPIADATHDSLAKIRARGTLLLPTDPAYPPSSFAVEGAARSPGTKCSPDELTRAELDGYDVAVGNLIADAIGVEPCYVVPTWNEMLAGHWSDRWDIAFASIGVEQDRMAQLYFTKPYIGSPERLWVRSDAAAQQMSDLDGKRIGVCTACWADLYLQKKLVRPRDADRLQGGRRQDRRLRGRGIRAAGRRRRQARRVPVRGHRRPGPHRCRRAAPGHRAGRLHRDPGRRPRPVVQPDPQAAVRPRQRDAGGALRRRDAEAALDEVLRARLRDAPRRGSTPPAFGQDVR